MTARLALCRNMLEGVVSRAESAVVEADGGGDLSCMLAHHMDGRVNLVSGWMHRRFLHGMFVGFGTKYVMLPETGIRPRFLRRAAPKNLVHSWVG